MKNILRKNIDTVQTGGSVERQQLRTREALSEVIGGVLAGGEDVRDFLNETRMYLAGRTVRRVVSSIGSMLKGIFRNAA